MRCLLSVSGKCKGTKGECRVMRESGNIPMTKDTFNMSCPLPNSTNGTVQLAHGGGGTLMHKLIDDVFLAGFDNPFSKSRHDGATLAINGQRIAFSTDSYVVQPLFFPGGDIGTLAVNGTVNDLSMCGARPRYLSAGFILEEGLSTDVLRRVVASMACAAREAGVEFVTGDTKVVDKGKGDGLFVNTAGVGLIEHDCAIGPLEVQVGDAVLLSGDLGRHGVAIMASREGLAFETTIESDCAPLNGIVSDLLDSGITLHCLRDLTRGGLASALVEIAEDSKHHIHVVATEIPVLEDVRGACEILGLDPVYVANEGRMIAIVPEDSVDNALVVMRRHPAGKAATCIGRVTEDQDNRVTIESEIGVTRILDMLSGEQLPRIC